MPGTSTSTRDRSHKSKRLAAWSLFPFVADAQCDLGDIAMQNPSEARSPANIYSKFNFVANGDAEPGVAEIENEEAVASPAPILRARELSIERPDHTNIRKEFMDGSAPGVALSTSPAPQMYLMKERPTNGFPPPRSSSRVESSEHPAPGRGYYAPMPQSNSEPASSSTPSGSREPSQSSTQTTANSLPALQHRALDENEHLQPLDEEDLEPGSFDLLAPQEGVTKQFNLETRSELLFSAEHLQTIFDDPALFSRFTTFLSSERPSSVPVLLFYLDCIKALKAISYANAIAESLNPLNGFDFTTKPTKPSLNADLEEKAQEAFQAMVREDLPAYVTHVYIRTASVSVQQRITGTLTAHLREASEGLAEVFCLTDPSRPDNPIVFASEEFHRTTQYGMPMVIGRNCRFLQGPKTNPFSVTRLRDRIAQGKEHSEVFLNYRRDGSPFMNLLMIAPLRDSRGVIRYFIGAQIDVSGLAKECSGLDSLRRLVNATEDRENQTEDTTEAQQSTGDAKKEFEKLSEMMNLEELEIVRRRGGRMRQYDQNGHEEPDTTPQNWNKPRLHLTSTSPDGLVDRIPFSRLNGKLSGVYENYLLVRPYPNLRVLFASPSLRLPGILQSPFMAKIGGSPRVREELTKAFAVGRGVTARVRWMSSKSDLEGRNRWIHCTPLLGSNGAIGVWMIIIVDEDDTPPTLRRYKDAPPVESNINRFYAMTSGDDGVSLSNFARTHEPMLVNGGVHTSVQGGGGSDSGSVAGDVDRRSNNPSLSSLRIY